MGYLNWEFESAALYGITCAEHVATYLEYQLHWERHIRLLAEKTNSSGKSHESGSTAVRWAGIRRIRTIPGLRAPLGSSGSRAGQRSLSPKPARRARGHPAAVRPFCTI